MKFDIKFNYQVSCCATDIIIVKLENDQPFYIDGIPYEGYCEHLVGDVLYSGYYKNGRKNGSFVLSYSQNAIVRCNYVNDVLDGIYKEINFDKYDPHRITYTYKMGVLDGPYASRNRDRLINGYYKNGKKSGKWTVYVDDEIKGWTCYENDMRNGQKVDIIDDIMDIRVYKDDKLIDKMDRSLRTGKTHGSFILFGKNMYGTEVTRNGREYYLCGIKFHYEEEERKSLLPDRRWVMSGGVRMQVVQGISGFKVMYNDDSVTGKIKKFLCI